MIRILTSMMLLLHTSFAYCAEDTRSLNGALRAKSPYYIIQGDGKISGLDADIAALVVLGTGLAPTKYDKQGVSWDEALKQIEKGEKDFIGNATKIPSREKWAHFSIPYRDEEHVILMKKSDASPFEKASEFTAHATKNKLKIAILKGAKYNSIEINKFIKNATPETVSLIVSDSYEDVINSLIEGKADVAIVDHIHAIYTLNEKGKGDEYKAVHVGAIAPQSFMFSKKTVRIELVEMINEKIRLSKDAIKRMTKEYISPIESASSNWLLPKGVTTLLEKTEAPAKEDKKEDKSEEKSEKEEKNDPSPSDPGPDASASGTPEDKDDAPIKKSKPKPKK